MHQLSSMDTSLHVFFKQARWRQIIEDAATHEQYCRVITPEPAINEETEDVCELLKQCLDMRYSYCPSSQLLCKPSCSPVYLFIYFLFLWFSHPDCQAGCHKQYVVLHPRLLLAFAATTCCSPVTLALSPLYCPLEFKQGARC